MIMIYEKNALPTTSIKNVTENAIKGNIKIHMTNCMIENSKFTVKNGMGCSKEM